MALYQQPGFSINRQTAQAYKQDIERGTDSFTSYRSALELGCGSGVFTEFLSAQGLDVTGVDRSASELTLAQERLPNVQI